MIRRTHFDSLFGRPLLTLPELSMRTISVEFSPVERAIYKIVSERFQVIVQRFKDKGVVRVQYHCIFTLFLRLRQLVGHILLIQHTLEDMLEAEDLEKLWTITEAEERPEAARHQQDVLQQLRAMIGRAYRNRGGSQEENVAGDSRQMDTVLFGSDGPNSNSNGSVWNFRQILLSLRQAGQWQKAIDRSLCHSCGSVPVNAHITSCMHIYCKDCIVAIQYEAATSNEEAGPVQAKCRECQTVFANVEPCQAHKQAERRLAKRKSNSSQHVSDIEGDDASLDWLEVGDNVLPSAKTLAVRVQIEEWQREDPEAKIIVFTQFRGMIRILSRIMEVERLGYVQFHGDMTFTARDRVLEDFRNNPDIKVMLSSLKAGGVGLNLTMASKVILLDLWWNESVENQAFCRSYRIGQAKPVDVCRIGESPSFSPFLTSRPPTNNPSTVVKDTIDDRLMQMQSRKTKEIDGALKNRPSKLTSEELLRLFDTVPSDQNPNPFIIIEDDAENDDFSDGEPPNEALSEPH